jgi:hypothetical protein
MITKSQPNHSRPNKKGGTKAQSACMVLRATCVFGAWRLVRNPRKCYIRFKQGARPSLQSVAPLFGVKAVKWQVRYVMCTSLKRVIHFNRLTCWNRATNRRTCQHGRHAHPASTYTRGSTHTHRTTKISHTIYQSECDYPGISLLSCEREPSPMACT